MDGVLYFISLAALFFLAVTFYRSNNIKLMLLVLAVGVYMIYSHQNRNSLSKFKEDMIESIDKSARDFSKIKGIGESEGEKALELIKGKE